MILKLGNIIIFLTCFYHLVAGIFVLGPKSWTQFFANNTYQLIIPNQYEPRYEVTLRFLGSMAVSLSLLLFSILIMGSLQLKTFVLVILGLLFCGRALLRIYLKQTIIDAYQLSFKKSLTNIIFNFVIGTMTLVTAYLSFGEIK
jgi:hypothetical protein